MLGSAKKSTKKAPVRNLLSVKSKATASSVETEEEIDGNYKHCHLSSHISFESIDSIFLAHLCSFVFICVYSLSFRVFQSDAGPDPNFTLSAKKVAIPVKPKGGRGNVAAAAAATSSKDSAVEPYKPVVRPSGLLHPLGGYWPELDTEELSNPFRNEAPIAYAANKIEVNANERLVTDIAQV